MKIILTLEEFKAKEPIYSFKLPEYMQQILQVTENEYYQAGMFAAQRLIDAYMQNYLSKKDWDISRLDKKLQEKIKDIMFMQFQYMHENQLFFEKTQDISYSTAGQQTFTFNTNFENSDDFPLIPKTIKRMIINTGILHYANSKYVESTNLSVYENQFLDGYFVPEVNWSDKANNEIAINGENTTVHNAIKYIFSNSIFKENKDYKHAIEITKLFNKKQQILELSNCYIKYNTFYPNKQEYDLAQIKDLSDLWSATNVIVDNNTSKIQQLVESINDLENKKIDKETFSSALANKANINLENVNVGTNPVRRYVQVDTNGNITFSVAAGDLKISKWKSDVEYSEGEATYIESYQKNEKVLIFIATDKEGNINKNPLLEKEFWNIYDIQIDLNNYLTINQANLNYLRLDGAHEMQANLDMGGYSIVNCNNILTNENIQDNNVNTSLLWSSSKIVDYINSIKTTLKIIKYEVGQVIAFTSKEAFLMIASEANKVQGIDYDFFENDLLIGNNENNEIKGTNLIKRSDLPNINTTYSISSLWSTTGSGIAFVHPRENTRSIAGNMKYGNLGTGTNTSGAGVGIEWKYSLNGNVEQTEFFPRRQTFCFVKILKTWYDGETNNISDESNNKKYYGQYPIIIDNEKSFISIDEEYTNSKADKNNSEQDIKLKNLEVVKSIKFLKSRDTLISSNQFDQIEIFSDDRYSEYNPISNDSIVNKIYVDNKFNEVNEQLNNKMNIINNSNDIGYNVVANTLYITPTWKDKINSNENEINNLKENKQDRLAAGNGISIVGNEISTIANEVDLSNYYNKSEVDSKLESKQDKLATTEFDNIKIREKPDTFDFSRCNENLAVVEGVLCEDLGEVYKKDYIDNQLVNKADLTNANQNITTNAIHYKTDKIRTYAYGDNELIHSAPEKNCLIVDDHRNENRLWIDQTNAYKKIGTKQAEVLASENWVMEKINASSSGIKTITGSKTCNNDTNTTLATIPNGATFINILVFRKRNDGMWFFKNGEDYSQIIIADDRTVKVWGVGGNNFTTSYKYVISYIE